MGSALECLQLNLYSYCEFSRKNREMIKEIHMVLVDLEKAHDRELIWWCQQTKCVTEGLTLRLNKT